MSTRGADSRLEDALAAGAARDYAGAIRILSSILAAGEAPVEALLYLGRSHHALGSWGRAIDSFRAYLRAGGDVGPGFFFLGRALLASGINGEAAKALAESVAAEPASASAWALLGAAELKLKKSVLAVEHLERAVNLAPADKRIYRAYLNALFVRGVRSLLRGEADLGAQTFRFVIENGLDGTAARLWRARALKQLGRFPEALVECEAAAAFSPDDPSIRWLRAGLLLSSGKRSEALAIFSGLGMDMQGSPLPEDEGSLDILRASRAFKAGRWKEAAASALEALRAEAQTRSKGGDRRRAALPPRARAGLHAVAAESLKELGLLARAGTEASLAVEADPDSPELRVSQAFILWDLGDYEGALAASEEARARGAATEETDYLSCLCKARLGQGGEATLTRLQSLLRSRTNRGLAPDPRLLFAIGEALYRLERPDLAGGWFEKVLELEPDHELCLLYRISVAESLGDEAGRSEACAAYLERYPDNNEIRREYAEALAKAENWEEVAKLLDEGLAWDDSSPGLRRMLARALRETGRYRDSAVMYRDLLLADPEDSELLMALCLCLSKDDKGAYALALLEKAPEKAMERAGPWIVKGILAERLGRIESAIDSFRQACEREGRLERPWRELARIYAERGLDAFAEEARAQAEALAAGAGKTRGRVGRPKATAAARGADPANTGEIPRPRKAR
jgi:tetratricopeptide (TPR) repeat protein